MPLVELYASLGLALGVGLLVGLQREQSRIDEPEEEKVLSLGGIRTHPIYALLGALGALLAGSFGPWAFVAIFAGAATPVVVAYAGDVQQGRDRGLTSEAALLGTFLLGALALSPSIVADTRERALVVAGLGVALTSLLALKRPLHEAVGRVANEDLFATIKFAVVALIVLPLLPDTTFGPLHVLNPKKIGWMIMLIAGVSFSGYVAIRVLGPGKGLGVTGLLGGIVSSTAVTLAFSSRSKAEPAVARACALGVVLANTVMPVRVIVNVAVVNPAMTSQVALAMGAVAAAGAASAGLLYGGKRAAGSEGDGVQLSNPFKLGSAFKFGALYAIILLVSKAATTYLPASGIYLAGLVAGTTDVDAISLSMASLVKEGSLAPEVGATTILLAVASNSLVKLGLAVSLGNPEFRRRVVSTFVAMLAAGALGVGLMWTL